MLKNYKKTAVDILKNDFLKTFFPSKPVDQTRFFKSGYLKSFDLPNTTPFFFNNWRTNMCIIYLSIVM